ncbi:phage tail protein [Nocardioides panacisoli]|uniref:Tail fiber protein n=1 Tax=Nocardioides panacisoli TaxID=627624 RepID=A0ABP7IZ81_9ACTN
MADPFLAEIRIFAFNFAPRGWAWCDGQLLPLSQNTALFSLLGTTYGGNGQSNFALPDLQGAAPMHPGQGNGLSNHSLGETGGVENVTLLTSEMPVHSHSMSADIIDLADTSTPGPAAVYAQSASGTLYQSSADTQLAATALAPAGGSQPHNNMQPYLTCNFNIALEGIYPARP